jgi:radical SAM superfamily enzyme YgiQ (UPF0313 family)
MSGIVMKQEEKQEKLKEILGKTGRSVPEMVAVRPPSEAHSLLIRVTRGCSWNRCVYCSAYGNVFSVRSVEDIKTDVELSLIHYGQGAVSIFLGDGDALELGIEPLIEVVEYIHTRFPRLKRLTSYSTPFTLSRTSQDDLKRLREAGLTRLHVGMESGDEEVLKLMQKGVSTDAQIEAGRKVVEADIELSEYIMLGLGGHERWEQHIEGSAKVLNAIDPHFIRVRTLAFAPGAPTFDELDVRKGKLKFKLYPEGYAEMQTPEGILLELRTLLDKLETVSSYLICDHSSNYFPEVRGKLPDDLEAMLLVLNIYENGIAEGLVKLPRVKLFT